MNDRPIKVTKAKDIEARVDEERSIETTMLQVLVRRYPDKARKFVKEIGKTCERQLA